jgi:hypothetical protein
MTTDASLPNLRERRQRPASTKTPSQKPNIGDRYNLMFSTSQIVDGLWVGTMEFGAKPGLRRAIDAIQLIKDHDPLSYARVVGHLERVRVHFVPHGLAMYVHRLRTCVLDERFVLAETTTLERIASAIVHEATHARLEGWGIEYVEQERTRIEAVCHRRERSFAGRLPNNENSEQLRQQIADSLAYYSNNHDYFSDASLQKQTEDGNVETLRYLNVPDWLIRFLLATVSARLAMHRFIRHCTERPPHLRG